MRGQSAGVIGGDVPLPAQNHRAEKAGAVQNAREIGTAQPVFLQEGFQEIEAGDARIGNLPFIWLPVQKLRQTESAAGSAQSVTSFRSSAEIQKPACRCS